MQASLILLMLKVLHHYVGFGCDVFWIAERIGVKFCQLLF